MGTLARFHAPVVAVTYRFPRIESAVSVGEALHTFFLVHVTDSEPATGVKIALIR